jgi:hypothetical protein
MCDVSMTSPFYFGGRKCWKMWLTQVCNCTGDHRCHSLCYWMRIALYQGYQNSPDFLLKAQNITPPVLESVRSSWVSISLVPCWQGMEHETIYQSESCLNRFPSLKTKPTHPVKWYWYWDFLPAPAPPKKNWNCWPQVQSSTPTLALWKTSKLLCSTQKNSYNAPISRQNLLKSCRLKVLSLTQLTNLTCAHKTSCRIVGIGFDNNACCCRSHRVMTTFGYLLLQRGTTRCDVRHERRSLCAVFQSLPPSHSFAWQTSSHH